MGRVLDGSEREHRRALLAKVLAEPMPHPTLQQLGDLLLGRGPILREFVRITAVAVPTPSRGRAAQLGDQAAIQLDPPAPPH